MSDKNPSVVLMLDQTINFNNFVANMNDDWEYKCKHDISEQPNFINYSFNYGNMLFVCSEFASKFPEDIMDDVKDSIYGDGLEEIYKNHTKFWVVCIVENSEKDLTKVYTFFTRVIMSMLRACEKSLVYNVRSSLVIESDMYLQMYDKMKSWYEKDVYIFPIEWYVNIRIYGDDKKLSSYTLGFDAFNGYEIEIHNKTIKYKEMLNIMKFIVIKVVSTYDKIKNKDIIPVPLDDNYVEAIVKQFNSEILNKEALAIIF